MLGMPEDRVRELAQTALAELAPATAKAVDDDWRGQVADYILGQQTGPESTATRGHLRRSEPARAWARSLLDSLDDLYEGDGRPAIPEGDRSAARAERRPRRERARPAADDEEDERPRGPLSPEARAAVRRRRLLGGLAAALVLVALIVLVWPVGVLTKDDEEPARRSANSGQERIAGPSVLRPVEGNRGGRAVTWAALRGKKRILLVQAQLPKPRGRQFYGVWLWNSDGDSRLIGAQQADRQGRVQGAALLPSDLGRFKYLDVSREPNGRPARHSGVSILRGPVAPLEGPGRPLPQQAGGTQQPQQGGAQQIPQGGGTQQP